MGGAWVGRAVSASACFLGFCVHCCAVARAPRARCCCALQIRAQTACASCVAVAAAPGGSAPQQLHAQQLGVPVDVLLRRGGGAKVGAACVMTAAAGCGCEPRRAQQERALRSTRSALRSGARLHVADAVHGMQQPPLVLLQPVARRGRHGAHGRAPAAAARDAGGRGRGAGGRLPRAESACGRCLPRRRALPRPMYRELAADAIPAVPAEREGALHRAGCGQHRTGEPGRRL